MEMEFIAKDKDAGLKILKDILNKCYGIEVREYKMSHERANELLKITLEKSEDELSKIDINSLYPMPRY